MASEQQLNWMADRLELVLASHRIPARVVGGQVTPTSIRFGLQTPLGVKARQVGELSEEIALSLKVSSCQVDRLQGQIWLVVPREGQA